MSGHSKWATIKRAKEAKDTKRGNIFTKHANNITIAARDGGGDPNTNFKLRLAIDRAKADSTPKENIERAIKRGVGELGGDVIAETVYGALFPAEIAVIIKCLTDNKNRTITEVKNAVVKNGGQMTNLNAVAWQFDNKGVIKIKLDDTKDLSKDDLEMMIIDSGADDFKNEEAEIIIYTKPEELKIVKGKLEDGGLKVSSADLAMIAKATKEVDDNTMEKISKLIDALDEVDEVIAYYTNLA